MPSVTFQGTIGTTAVLASSLTGVSATTPCTYGLKLVLPTGNANIVYYGYTSGVTTSTGVQLMNGQQNEIAPTGLIPSTGGNPTLAGLWFIAGAAGQTITGEALS